MREGRFRHLRFQAKTGRDLRVCCAAVSASDRYFPLRCVPDVSQRVQLEAAKVSHPRAHTLLARPPKQLQGPRRADDPPRTLSGRERIKDQMDHRHIWTPGRSPTATSGCRRSRRSPPEARQVGGRPDSRRLGLSEGWAVHRPSPCRCLRSRPSCGHDAQSHMTFGSRLGKTLNDPSLCQEVASGGFEGALGRAPCRRLS